MSETVEQESGAWRPSRAATHPGASAHRVVTFLDHRSELLLHLRHAVLRAHLTGGDVGQDRFGHIQEVTDELVAHRALSGFCGLLDCFQVSLVLLAETFGVERVGTHRYAAV